MHSPSIIRVCTRCSMSLNRDKTKSSSMRRSRVSAWHTHADRLRSTMHRRLAFWPDSVTFGRHLLSTSYGQRS